VCVGGGGAAAVGGLADRWARGVAGRRLWAAAGTGKVDYLLPIILTTVCAKWVGDHLNEGFYHNALHIKGIPFLDNEPTRAMNTLTAENIMSRNVKVLHERSTVADVIDLLEFTEHDGFPVVREKSMGTHASPPPARKTVATPLHTVRRSYAVDHSVITRRPTIGKDVVLNIYRGTVLRSTLAALISRRRFYREAIGGEQDAAGRAKLERVPSRLVVRQHQCLIRLTPVVDRGALHSTWLWIAVEQD
jgi:CBS domain-containing protein